MNRRMYDMTPRRVDGFCPDWQSLQSRLMLAVPGDEIMVVTYSPPLHPTLPGVVRRRSGVVTRLDRRPGRERVIDNVEVGKAADGGFSFGPRWVLFYDNPSERARRAAREEAARRRAPSEWVV